MLAVQQMHPPGGAPGGAKPRCSLCGEHSRGSPWLALSCLGSASTRRSASRTTPSTRGLPSCGPGQAMANGSAYRWSILQPVATLARGQVRQGKGTGGANRWSTLQPAARRPWPPLGRAAREGGSHRRSTMEQGAAPACMTLDPRSRIAFCDRYPPRAPMHTNLSAVGSHTQVELVGVGGGLQEGRVCGVCVWGGGRGGGARGARASLHKHAQAERGVDAADWRGLGRWKAARAAALAPSP